MLTVKLTPGQRSAVEIMIEALNSADVGDGRKRDQGAVKALTNVLDKLRAQRAR